LKSPSEYDHPLYSILMLGPGSTERQRPVGGFMMLVGLNETKRGHQEMMEEFVSPLGQRRVTLRAEIREWLAVNRRDQVTILAGCGAAWVRFWSKEDGALFKLFWMPMP